MCKENTYTVSKHAKERYAERIMEKDSTVEIKTFIAQNEDKIVNDINKMIQYGDLIYSGKQTQKDGRKYDVEVYLKGSWVILADVKSKNVITLYKIDLCLGDEFNKEYINKMLEKFNIAKHNYDLISEQLSIENKNYEEIINDNISTINKYKTFIKNLEELNDGYNIIIKESNVKISMAEIEMLDVLNKLIGKKEF